MIQHQGEAATYAFVGSAAGVMQQLFADPKRPLLDQAVPRQLAPLPIGDVADYVSTRFDKTARLSRPSSNSRAGTRSAA